MSRTTVSLPQYTLDQLADRVALKVDYFNRILHADNVWEGVVERCEKIEEEPRSVNSVILEIKKKYKSTAVGGICVIWYHVWLTCIYILLYYLHRDDNKYKLIVFPELVKNMGIFGEDKILKPKINQEIDKIIDLDKIVAEAQNRKNAEPLFAFKGLNGAQRDRLFDDYSEELLFREIIDIIDALNKEYATRHDVVTIWYNAKLVVKALSEVRRPELYIVRVARALVKGQVYNGYEGAQIILLCAYAMIHSAKDNTHFAKFIEKMESYSLDDDTDLGVIRCYIHKLKQWCESEPLPYDDYDYIGEHNTRPQTFTSADIEQIRKQIIEQEKNERERLLKEKEDLEAQLKEKDALENSLKEYETSENINWGDKVRLALLLHLMKKDGANLEIYGNKAKAASLMQIISGLPISTCTNYCTNQDLSLTHHEEEILQLNSKMQALGMETRL